MFAVIYIGGKQYKVHEKDEIEVELMDVEVDKNVKINEVLLLGEENGENVKIGTPYVSGVHVECKVMEHGRGEKIRVVKFKPKKRYSKVQGHRQSYTKLKVLKISAVQKKAVAKKEDKTKEEPKE